MKYKEAYKKGHKDGLEEGVNENPYENNGMCDEWWTYQQGYESGVSDYCREIDKEETE
jgi:flagellar biosynthesis/type III secretory pathway protein FliH